MDNKGYFESPEFREILKRYEQTQACSYFEIYELSDILAYYLYQDKTDAAESVLEKAQKMHPGAEELVKMEVKLLLGKGEPEQAMFKLSEINKPEDDETKLLQAEIMLAMKDYRDAREIAIELLNRPQITKELACEALELMLDCGFAQDALQITEYALQKYPQEKCFREIKAECLIELQYIGDAIDIYNDLLDSEPYSTFYWEQLAHIYYMTNKYGKALECFEYEVAINEEIEYARMMQGYCYYFLRDYTHAREVFETLSQKYPASIMPRFYIALCHYATGDNEGALSIFDDIIELAEEASIEAMLARINRAILLYKTGEKESAVGAISLALLMHPQNMKQLLLCDNLLYELRDKENLTFKEMNVIDIKDWSAEEELFALARHLMRHECWEPAKTVLLYTRQISREPSDIDACTAYTMHRLGETELTHPYIESALNEKSNILFELFQKPYDANIGVEEFLTDIKKQG